MRALGADEADKLLREELRERGEAERANSASESVTCAGRSRSARCCFATTRGRGTVAVTVLLHSFGPISRTRWRWGGGPPSNSTDCETTS